jgi:hypothetical protein
MTSPKDGLCPIETRGKEWARTSIACVVSNFKLNLQKPMIDNTAGGIRRTFSLLLRGQTHMYFVPIYTFKTGF